MIRVMVIQYDEHDSVLCVEREDRLRFEATGRDVFAIRSDDSRVSVRPCLGGKTLITLEPSRATIGYRP